MTKVSVRLGDLTAAVDHEAALARRTRSEMVRFLIEDALATRQQGMVRYAAAAPVTIQVDGAPPETFTAGPMVWIERFEGCETPNVGVTYQVLKDEWDTNVTPMLRIIREIKTLY